MAVSNGMVIDYMMRNQKLSQRKQESEREKELRNVVQESEEFPHPHPHLSHR
jgi:hypothetical protein